MELMELVRRAKTGNTDAQGALYEAVYKRAYYLALRLTKQPQDAEDATQEAFIAACGALRNLQNDNAFEGWLFQIVANKCRNKLTRTKQTEELPEGFEAHTPDPNESFLPEAVLQNAENRRLIVEIIDSLPDAQRECVMLFYYSELNIKQIAETLDCSEGTVKSRLNYARQKIRDGILETEMREGIRLHALVPFGLLFANDCEAVTAGLTVTAMGGMNTLTASAAAGSTTSKVVKAGLLASMKAKVIAAVTAAVILTGGAAVYQEIQSVPAESSAQIPAADTSGIDSGLEPFEAAAEDDWLTQPISFADTGMEHNIRLLLHIPADQSVTPEDLLGFYQVGFIGGGMNMFNGENWLGNNVIEAVTGTVPVENFSDLQYFAGLDAHMVISIVDPTYHVDLDQIREVIPHVRFEYHDGRGFQP